MATVSVPGGYLAYRPRVPAGTSIRIGSTTIAGGTTLTAAQTTTLLGTIPTTGTTWTTNFPTNWGTTANRFSWVHASAPNRTFTTFDLTGGGVRSNTIIPASEIVGVNVRAISLNLRLTGTGSNNDAFFTGYLYTSAGDIRPTQLTAIDSLPNSYEFFTRALSTVRPFTAFRVGGITTQDY